MMMMPTKQKKKGSSSSSSLVARLGYGSSKKRGLNLVKPKLLQQHDLPLPSTIIKLINWLIKHFIGKIVSTE